MLERARRMRIPHDNRLFLFRCTHAIRHDPVRRKITAADHIASTTG